MLLFRWRLSHLLSVSQVKSAASYALGSIAVGNLPEYLPFVLQEISSSKRQYLLLHSLKEIISEEKHITFPVCVCVCLVLTLFVCLQARHPSPG